MLGTVRVVHWTGVSHHGTSIPGRRSVGLFGRLVRVILQWRGQEQRQRIGDGMVDGLKLVYDDVRIFVYRARYKVMKVFYKCGGRDIAKCYDTDLPAFLRRQAD
ncbi:MAG: hypothetical protein KAJ73_00425 [Zetaproteobacteria bacterium]|nr:hypothetical protein [Zetaproteobacteria bacterium]